MIAKYVETVQTAAHRHPALLSLLLGALAATGFAPLGWWPVTLLCVAGWMWLIHEARSLRGALLRGWLFGVGHFTIGNNWIQHAFTYQDAMPHWLGYLAVVLLALYLAVYPMLAAGLSWRFGRTARIEGGYVLTFGAAWIATEWLRGTMFTGYPWNPLSVIWVPAGGVTRLAAFVGTYALSGLTVLTSGAILLLATRRWILPIVTGVPIALLLLIGPRDAPPLSHGPAAPRVRVIQPNLAQYLRPLPDFAETSLRTQAGLSGTPGEAPRLIVWPESAVSYLLEDGYPDQYYWQAYPQATRRRLAHLLGPRDILLTGGDTLFFDKAGTLTSAANSIFAIDAHGAIRTRYDKAHLVPYGEYLPMRPILGAIGLSRLVPGDMDFRPGPGPAGAMLAPFGGIGFQICYEIVFSGEVVDESHRPRLLFNPSNDSWFGSWGPPEHLAQARLRAVEEGLPILRSTPTGISAIIAANGQLLASIPPHRAGAIELPMPAPFPPTLFARLGNWAAAIVAIGLLLLAVALRSRRR